MPTSAHLPVTARPALRVSRSASGADVVVAALIGAEGSATGAKIVGLAPRAVKEAETSLGTDLASLAIRMGGSPKPGSTVVLPWKSGSLVLVGAGETAPADEDLRQAAGWGVRAAAELAGDTGVKVAIDMGIGSAEGVRIAAEGALLGAYHIPRITESECVDPIAEVTIVSQARGAKPELRKAEIMADAVFLARDWINTPANLLYPESFATSATEELGDIANLSVDVLDEKALASGGYGGLLAVGKGSNRKPRLVRADYHPEGASTTLALVGKGITFDSGGLNIKTADGMYTMKCDMGGAAAVLAAIKAIARLELPIHVIGYGCMAENMPSGKAWRPSDVVTIHGGRTVENSNSDAEGRIVMADGLARSTEDDPDMVVDIATLTGACMVALGTSWAGLMTSSTEAADTLLDASEAAGENFWELPITDEVREGLHSDIADTKSSGSRAGGAMGAAAFLQGFVSPQADWAHLDIAGPAFNESKAHDYTPLGGTGFGVRTLVHLAANLAS